MSENSVEKESANLEQTDTQTFPPSNDDASTSQIPTSDIEKPDSASSEEKESQEKTEDHDDVKQESNENVDQISQLEERLRAEEETLDENALKERLGTSQLFKEEANNFYKDGNYLSAIQKYSEALEVCPLRHTRDRAVLHANRAAAYMGNSMKKEALPDLNRAVNLDPTYNKALERRARLNWTLEFLDDALSDYKQLLKLKPTNSEYAASIKDLEHRIHVRDEEAKAKMIDSLKQLGNAILKPFGLSTENFSMVSEDRKGFNFKMEK